MLSVLTSGLGVLGVKIVTGFVSGMINRDHSANLAAQNRASQEAMCKARLKSQAELEAARREAQERIEEKRQKFQAYMETERRNFQRELEQNRQESQFILETRRQEFQRQMEEKRRQFQLELEKERQEFQTYLESNRQQFQLEVNKSNAELQRELSAQNHAFRLEEINTNFELTRRTQEYQQVEAKWPLHVPPVVMRGEQVLKDRTIALRVLFARSSDAYLQKFFYPIIEQELVDFVDLYKNNLSSRNIIFFHNAWKDECYGGAFGNNIHFALSDLPVLIADANVLPSGQIRISVTMWGVGSDTEFHGNIFKCPYDKSRFKDENYVLEIAYKVSAYLKFAIGYVYDLYNLIAYNRMPLLPAAVALEKNNLIDSALLNYEEIKQCLTDTYSRMYSQTLSITDGSQQSVYDTQAEDVQLLVDSKKTILHELRLNYALAVKDYVSTEQYLQCLDESIRAWVDLRTDKSAEEFLQDLAGNGDEVEKYFSDEDKRYFITLCDAYYNAKQKHELGNICLKLSVYVNGKAAIKYYRKEAEQGTAEAQYCLGVCYYTSGDYKEAVKWYRLAAEAGHNVAKEAVNDIEQEIKEQEERKKAEEKLAALRKAAEDGDAEAQYVLNVCNDNQPFDEDIDKAFNLYNQRKERIKNIVVEIKTLLKQVYVSQQCTLASKLDRLEDKLNNDAFRVVTISEYTNGKSTLINAMLGKDVLPSYATPTTAVISDVKYGEYYEKCMLYFVNPIPKDNYSELIPDDIKQHIEKYNGKDVPPLEICLEDIEDYIVIPEYDYSESIDELHINSPYRKVDLFYPINVLKQGVNFIDCPMLIDIYLNNYRFWYDKLNINSSDAIMLVLAADRLCSQFEMDLLENELKDFTGSIFFVVNRFDLIRKKSERDRVKQFANLKLQNLPSRGIYYVSASQALKAKENGDPILLYQSGIVKLEHELYNFLAFEKGREKIRTYLEELNTIICQICDAYDSTCYGSRYRFSQKLKENVKIFCIELSNNIYRWINEYKTSVFSSPWRTGRELFEHLFEKLQSFCFTWNKNGLLSSFSIIFSEEELINLNKKVRSALYLRLYDVLNDVYRLISTLPRIRTKFTDMSTDFKQSAIYGIKKDLIEDADCIAEEIAKSTIEYIDSEFIGFNWQSLSPNTDAKLASFKQECDSMLSEFMW